MWLIYFVSDPTIGFLYRFYTSEWILILMQSMSSSLVISISISMTMLAILSIAWRSRSWQRQSKSWKLWCRRIWRFLEHLGKSILRPWPCPHWGRSILRWRFWLTGTSGQNHGTLQLIRLLEEFTPILGLTWFKAVSRLSRRRQSGHLPLPRQNSTSLSPWLHSRCNLICNSIQHLVLQ